MDIKFIPLEMFNSTNVAIISALYQGGSLTVTTLKYYCIKINLKAS